MGSAETGVFATRNERDCYKLFWVVVNTYIDIRQISPVIALNPDPSARSRKLGPDLIHYLADVELATRRILNNPVLFEFWQRLIQGEAIPPETERQIILKCSRIYSARKLLPGLYFRSVRTRLGRGRAGA